MMIFNRAGLDAVETAHARFNAKKTLSTMAPSAFASQRFGGVTATRDAARLDRYYNRVLLGPVAPLTTELDAAIAWVAAVAGRNIRIDAAAGHGLDLELTARGFQHDTTLVWLAAQPRAEDFSDLGARELVASDRSAIRQLLEEQGPIDRAIWNVKRSYLCTDSFRWFGVFANQVLVSAASLWLNEHSAVLGSAYTHVDHRRRGHQSMLLTMRMSATPLPLLVDVEPETTSHRNCRAAGFREIETRQVWVRPGRLA